MKKSASNWMTAGLAALSAGLLSGPGMAGRPVIVIQATSESAAPPEPRLVVQRGHYGAVTTVAGSPDGRRVVTGGADGTAILWDAATGRELRRYDASDKPILAVAFRPNGQQFATGSADSVIRIWNVDAASPSTDTGKPGNSAVPSRLLGQTLPDRTRQRAEHRDDGHTDAVTSLAFSPVGLSLLSGSRDGTMLLWDLRTGTKIMRYRGHRGAVTCVGFASSGQMVASGGEDRRVCIWSAAGAHATGPMTERSDPDWTTPPFDGTVTAIALTLNADARRYNLYAAVGSTVRCLSADGSRTSDRRFDLDSQIDLGEPVNAVFTLPNGLSGEEDTDPRASWFVAVTPRHAAVCEALAAMPRRMLSLSENGSDADCAAYVPSTTNLITGHVDGTAVSIGMAAAGGAPVPMRFAGVATGLRAVAVSGDGRRLFLLPATPTKALPNWDLRTGLRDTSAFRHPAAVTAMATSAAAHELFCGLENGKTVIWNITRQRQSRVITRSGPASPITAIAIAAKSGRVFLGARDGITEIWDTRRRACLAKLRGDRPVVAVAVAGYRENGYTATLYDDGKVRLWTLSMPPRPQSAKGRKAPLAPVKTLTASFILVPFRPSSAPANTEEGEPRFVARAIAFSPDGRYLVAGGGDGLIRTYDLGTGQTETYGVGDHFAGDPDPAAISALTFSRDGSTVISGGEDGTVSEWNTGSSKRTSHSAAHLDAVCSVLLATIGGHDYRCTVSADGSCQLMAAGAAVPTVSITRLGTADWVIQDADQRFDADGAGDGVLGLHYVWHNEVITLPQMASEFYEPGLLGDVLQRKQNLRHVVDLSSVLPYPDVQIVAPAEATNAVLVIRARGGGIGPVSVLLNGKLVTRYTAAELVAPSSDTASTEAGTVRRSVNLSLASGWHPAGDNTLRVEASNLDGTLAGFYERTLKTPAGLIAAVPEQPGGPRLFILGVGISQYTHADAKLKTLPYSDGDVAAVCHGLAMAGRGKFGDGTEGGSRVEVSQFSTAAGAARPTKDNIKAAFKTLKKAAPGDYVIIFLSGHGVSHADLDVRNPTYYFLTVDVDPTRTNDPLLARAEYESNAVSSDDLATYLSEIPARHCALFIDTCAAGAVGPYLDKAWLSTSRGACLLTACSASQSTYEVPGWGHGMLALAMLMALAGSGIDETSVGLDRLFGFSLSIVRTLSNQVEGTDVPNPARQFPNQSFEFGFLEKSQQLEIAKTLPPIVEEPTLTGDADLDSDILQDLSKQLATISTSPSGKRRNSKTGFVYIDGNQRIAHSIQPTVVCRGQNGRITATITFLKDGHTFGNPLRWAGRATELPRAVASRIAATAMAAAGQTATLGRFGIASGPQDGETALHGRRRTAAVESPARASIRSNH